MAAECRLAWEQLGRWFEENMVGVPIAWFFSGKKKGVLSWHFDAGESFPLAEPEWPVRPSQAVESPNFAQAAWICRAMARFWHWGGFLLSGGLVLGTERASKNLTRSPVCLNNRPMGFFSQLIGSLSSRNRAGVTRSLAAAPFSPRRLEGRRLLDASAVGLMFAPLGEAGEYVQVGENADSLIDDLGPDSAPGLSQDNVPPSNIQFALIEMIDENNFAQLELTFDDPGTLDTHTVEIDWGDGSTTTVNLAGGERFVGVSHQYLDDSPTNTPQDLYTISVKVTDNEGASTTGQTTVLVKNVAPSNLQFAPVAMIDENNFAQLELTFDDPGTLDTYTVEIDWGDGNSTTVNLAGGERFIGISHRYLDDSPTSTPQDTYTISVKVTDDDGGSTTGQTTVLVKNVAPVIETLTVTPSVTTEGNTVTVSGTYSDVGTLDTQTGTIRWGDGTVEELVLVGSGGSGSFTISYFYADNDTVNPDDAAADNLYRIIVSIVDDDSGGTVRPVDVTVLNVSPNLEPIISATNVNAKGETFLTLEFDDPGADTLTIYVDWGDIRDPNDPSIPAINPFVIDVTGIQAPGTFTVTLKHVYSGPPNPFSPASDIEINVFVTDDDFGEPLVFADGKSQIRSVAISNAGDGTDPVRIDTTPQVPRLIFPRQSLGGVFFEPASASEDVLRSGDLRAASGDPSITTDRFLELRVIDFSGELGQGYRLKTEVLNDLPGLFRELPDNHYAIYLVRNETNTRRLVIEVYVRNGKVIDPGDDSEGTRDRPPTEEAVPQSSEELNLEIEPQEEGERAAPADPAADDFSSRIELPQTQGSTISENLRSRLPVGAAAVGLVATHSYHSWARRVDRAVAQAGSRDWKRLQRRTPPKRNNR